MNSTNLTLNLLIETCLDGAKGYQLAAKLVNNQHYKQLFRSFAKQREEYAQSLQLIVLGNQGWPQTSTTPVLASIHYFWMKLRAFVTRGTPQVILHECERGDQVALRNYQSALRSNLPATIRPIVTQQYNHVQSTYLRVRVLQNASLRLTDNQRKP